MNKQVRSMKNEGILKGIPALIPFFKKHPTAAACIVFIVLIIMFFNGELRSGRYLIAGNSLYAFPPWTDLPTQEQRFQNFDIPLQFYPWRAFIREHYLNGTIPLWNPHAFSGSPFTGNIQTQAFYIPDLPFILSSPEHSFLCSAMVKIFLACLGAYLLASFLGITFFPALMSGIIYGFSGFIILWLGYPHSTIAAWAPWSLLTMEHFLSKPKFRTGLFFSAVTAVHLLAGHPEISTYLLLFTIGYTILRGIQKLITSDNQYRVKLKKYLILIWIPSLVIGLLAAMIIYLPFLEYLTNSMVYQARANKQMSEVALPVICLNLLLMPRAYGSPAHGGFYFPALFPQYGQSTYGEIAAPYFGLWPLFFALIGIVTSLFSRHKFIPVSFFGLIIALILYGFPGVNSIVGLIPIVKLGFILRTAFIMNLCGAILAGTGLHFLINISLNSKKWVYIATIFFVLSLTTVLVFFSLHIAPNLNRLKLGNAWYNELQFFLIILFSGAFLILIGVAFRSKIPYFLLAIVIIGELFRFGYGYNASVKPDRLAPPHPVIAIMSHDDTYQRFAGFSSTFFPNAAMMYHLDDVRGYDALTPFRYYRLAESFDPTLTSLRNASNPAYMLMMKFPANLLKLLSIGHLIFPPNIDVEDFLQDISREHFKIPQNYPTDFQTKIIEYTESLPRFYITRKFSIVETDEEELRRLSSDTFSPGHEITLRTKPGISAPKSDDAFYSVIETQFHDINQVNLKVTCSHPAILASTEPYFPGWKVRLNGREIDLLRCNFAFRAVEIPVGMNEISFIYQPISFIFGAFITLSALMIWLAIFISKPSNPRLSKRQIKSL